MHAGGADGIRKAAGILLLLMLMMLWAREALAQEADEAADRPAERLALVLDVEGPIGPATRDFVSRSLKKAAERDAALVIIRMDTPGGLDASTRDIIKDILNSSVPVATWVGPAGARAASAGTYILYASHIAAMSPATNVGAATPVAIIGGTPGQDKDTPDGKGKKKHEGAAEEAEDAEQLEDAEEAEDAAPAAAAGDAMMKKAVNDSVAYIRGLAEKRGRNADWAERAVREADSITSEKALELGVIDLIAANIADLLEQADGRIVEVNDRDVTLDTSGLVTERLEPDWRSELLAVITSPTIAYMLLLIGVYGLILEGYNPGAILPGVVGAISLLLALYAFQMLPVNYAGLGLIILGIILMIAEVMSPSFGALGFGGIIAMVVGSIILMDTDVPGYTVSRSLIGSIAVAGSLGMMAIVWIAVRARQRPVVSGREELVGAAGVAVEDFAGAGHVYVHSERWNAFAEVPVRENQAVVVTGLDGLTLKVRPVTAESQEQEDV
ncbi:MAG: nodulation protein NfeD [Xanthomonadales bacterium]|jgi:membrane-bound serine protease (ClpP class)|nr:nodulation protein NfeD [Xanthomonadales bacterium]